MQDSTRQEMRQTTFQKGSSTMSYKEVRYAEDSYIRSLEHESMDHAIVMLFHIAGLDNFEPEILYSRKVRSAYYRLSGRTLVELWWCSEPYPGESDKVYKVL